MKRGLFIFIFLFLVGGVYAQQFGDCNLDVVVLNQDPYPAVPGEYVKVLFQISGAGIENPSCKSITFELLPEYPFVVDDEDSLVVELESGSYARNYNSVAVIPYKLRIDENALNGANEIEARYSLAASNNWVIKRFEIEVEDVRTDFEISIKDYNSETNTLTFEILNIGKADAEALTIDIPQQSNIVVKGSKRNIVGSLDSKEDTSFSFEATPRAGEITLLIKYTDELDVRRELTRTVYYDPSYFDGRVRDAEKQPTGYYLAALIVILIVIIFLAEKIIKNVEKKKHHAHTI